MAHADNRETFDSNNNNLIYWPRGDLISVLLISVTAKVIELTHLDQVVKIQTIMKLFVKGY